MFKNNNIRRRVMSEIERRIEVAQNEYDKRSEEINEELMEQLERLRIQAVSEKATLENELVGKFFL